MKEKRNYRGKSGFIFYIDERTKKVDKERVIQRMICTITKNFKIINILMKSMILSVVKNLRVIHGPLSFVKDIYRKKISVLLIYFVFNRTKNVLFFDSESTSLKQFQRVNNSPSPSEL